MASSASAISLSSPPLTFSKKPLSSTKFQPVTLSLKKSNQNRKSEVRASNNESSVREKAVSVATAAALAAALVVPEIADAAGPGISPSLKNFLLSIASGGVVVTAIIGVVVGVSNFDPVKRG